MASMLVSFQLLDLASYQLSKDGRSPSIDSTTQWFYEGCMMGEHQHDSFPKNLALQASHPLELVHSDICKPMITPFIGGDKCLFTFIDDLS
jgi:hypothetical protein